MTFPCIGDQEVPTRQGLGVWDLEDKEDWGGLSGHGTAERQWGRLGGGVRGRESFAEGTQIPVLQW